MLFGQRFSGGILEKLVTQATPEANNDHLRTRFAIIAVKSSGMGLKQKIKQVPAVYNALLFILNKLDYFNRRFRSRYPSYRVTPAWQQRIDTVLASPDNARLPHVENAGQLFKDHQLMHNGLKITLGSYYDYGNTHLLLQNRGVHEPQEEFAFMEILKSIPSGAVMMELGSYWAFYSMWFAKSVTNARCLMIEPDPHKMNFGKLNFALNGLQGTFESGFIADIPNLKPAIPYFTVDQLMTRHHINRLHILHSDIQGFEGAMLKGASDALANKKIDYLFISTHSQQLHPLCMDSLKAHDYQIVCEADLEKSYAVDGLIVAKRPGAAGPDRITISKRGEV